jgi:hypothetical protein
MSEEVFHFLTVFLCYLVLLDLIFKTVFTLWIYIYIYRCNLFCIEPLIVHSYLNDAILI